MQASSPIAPELPVEPRVGLLSQRPSLDLAIVIVVKVVASLVVMALGFRAVSDDDFSRVAIAESWASSPKLDPTGTTWLPAPFWVTGAVMMVFGRSLQVAQGVALAWGIAAALLIYASARLLSTSRGAALVGTILAATFAWSARLGVATVPELPTAAFTLFGIASLTQGVPRQRVHGGAALLFATLSRYEAWAAALLFAAFSLFDAFVAKRESRQWRGLLLGALLAILGPTAWMAWNLYAHGDALRFFSEVAAYHKAAGGVAGLHAALAYPAALVTGIPELWGVLMVAGLAQKHQHRMVPQPWSLVRPYAIAAIMLLTLSFSVWQGGGPTHHAERAVLTQWLLLAIVVGGVLYSALASLRGLASVVLVVATVAVFVVVQRWVRPLLVEEAFSPRTEEVAIGSALAKRILSGEKILLEVEDYNYFAFVAALGRPEDIIVDRDINPRKAQKLSSFEDAATLSSRLAQGDAGVFVGRVTPITIAVGGEPLLQKGSFGAWYNPSIQEKK
jgi:hypothetical protein